MTNKTQVYLIGSDISKFEYDIYCSKKIKSLSERNVNLNAIFARNFEELPVVKKYCLKHKIETIDLEKDEKNYFVDVVRYNLDNPDKKNLAVLVSEKRVKALRLNFFFKQDPCFNPHLI